MTGAHAHIPYGPGTLNDGSFERTVTAIHEANPDSRLVGSLGRAILWNEYYADPYMEYDARGERPLATAQRLARDLDFLNAPNMPDMDTPYPIDTVWAHNAEAAVLQTADGQWRLQSDRRGFDEPLDPEVMAPVHGKTVFGVEATTVNPMTHVVLFAVRGTLRRKDELAINMLTKLLTTQDCPILPMDTYEPFWELADMQRQGAAARLGRMAHRLAPKPLAGLAGDILFAAKHRKYR